MIYLARGRRFLDKTAMPWSAITDYVAQRVGPKSLTFFEELVELPKLGIRLVFAHDGRILRECVPEDMNSGAWYNHDIAMVFDDPNEELIFKLTYL